MNLVAKYIYLLSNENEIKIEKGVKTTWGTNLADKPQNKLWFIISGFNVVSDVIYISGKFIVLFQFVRKVFAKTP